MPSRKSHPRDEIIGYLDGTLSDGEKRVLEEHLKNCGDCKNYLSRAQDFNQNLSALEDKEFVSQEPCPDSWTLVAYEAGKVDEVTARNLRTHMLFCDDCREEFYSLRRTSRTQSWDELINHLKEFVVDLARTYGPQTPLGSIRILAEQPVLARGSEGLMATSKVLEVPLGDNTYSIELTVTEEGSVSCDIAGASTPVEVPLSISLRSENAGELLSAQSDKFGNGHFVVPRESFPDDLLLLTLSLQDKEFKFLLRVPEMEGG